MTARSDFFWVALLGLLSACGLACRSCSEKAEAPVFAPPPAAPFRSREPAVWFSLPMTGEEEGQEFSFDVSEPGWEVSRLQLEVGCRHDGRVRFPLVRAAEDRRFELPKFSPEDRLLLELRVLHVHFGLRRRDPDDDDGVARRIPMVWLRRHVPFGARDAGRDD